jgi:hypothetical protein|tara:strand:+ start:129 stop:1292 length:1164 start_codon:yes stop_codon:yes gene_type:complete
MAYYSIFPEKDTTLYSHPDRKNMNTGGDSILELVEEKSNTGEIYYPSRILIKFKNSEIKDVIENKIKKEINTTNCKVDIQLYSTENSTLSQDHIIESFPLSQSWNEGSEKYDTNPPYITNGSLQAANGSTWVHRTDSTASKWVTSSFNAGSTGSNTTSEGGGVWHIGSDFRAEATFFSENDFDLDLDVTTIISKFSASYYQDASHPIGIPNNGFIIKKPRITEEDGFGFGGIKYFSSNTHTIYPPKLTFRWDDSVYNNGGGTVLNNGDIFLSLQNNKATFQRKSIQKFRITSRKRYPNRTFVTDSNYLDTQYLPTTSYYSIRDAETDEVIIPFDTEYTKLSADSEGMYFNLWMEGFQPERYYKIMFRVDNNDGINVHDEDYFFKIIR